MYACKVSSGLEKDRFRDLPNVCVVKLNAKQAVKMDTFPAEVLFTELLQLRSEEKKDTDNLAEFLLTKIKWINYLR